MQYYCVNILLNCNGDIDEQMRLLNRYLIQGDPSDPEAHRRLGQLYAVNVGTMRVVVCVPQCACAQIPQLVVS